MIRTELMGILYLYVLLWEEKWAWGGVVSLARRYYFSLIPIIL